MSDPLKRIEEKHRASNVTAGYCPECHGSHPCDVVKLARALVELIEDHGHTYDEYTNEHMVPRCDACVAERVLNEVAGGSDD